MSNSYRYDHQSRSHKKRHAFIIFTTSFFVIAFLAITILYLIDKTTKKINSVSGPSVLVGQIAPNPGSQATIVNEPTYTFNLPEFWRQTKVESSTVQNSVTWQSFESGATNRYLTIYTDPIPSTYAVNLELPLEAHGSTLSFGSISANCANFTNTPTKSAVPVLAKWENVDFYCNSPDFVDNQVGTGTIGSINSIELTGPQTGTHHFFFLYIDRNNTPDYTIFYSILNSFQVK